MMAKGGAAAQRKKDQDLDTGFNVYFWMVHLMAAIGLIGLMYVAVLRVRSWMRRVHVRHLEIFVSEAGHAYH